VFPVTSRRRESRTSRLIVQVRRAVTNGCKPRAAAADPGASPVGRCQALGWSGISMPDDDTYPGGGP